MMMNDTVAVRWWRVGRLKLSSARANSSTGLFELVVYRYTTCTKLISIPAPVTCFDVRRDPTIAFIIYYLVMNHVRICFVLVDITKFCQHELFIILFDMCGNVFNCVYYIYTVELWTLLGVLIVLLFCDVFIYCIKFVAWFTKIQYNTNSKSS